MSPPSGWGRGGGLAGGASLPVGPAARTVALRRLRALHAEAGRLRLRRIEVRIELHARRRAIAEIEAAAGSAVQGPVEAAVFERHARAAIDLTIEARQIDQRLYRLRLEIAAAQARAVTAAFRIQREESREP